VISPELILTFFSAAMKKIISLISLISLISFTAYAKGPVAEGNTHCCLGIYTVEKTINYIIVDGEALPTYEVSYGNSDLTVRVGVDMSDKKCTRYIVASDNLSVQYDCNRKYFGVNKLDRKYSKDGYVTSDLTLDRSEYFHQKIISQDVKDQIEQIKLISVFFPKLVKDYEKVFAVK